MWLWILAGVVILIGGSIITAKVMIRGALKWTSQIFVDGEPVKVTEHFGSGLPEFLGHDATTIGFHIGFDGYPRSLNILGRIISQNLVANEIFHVVDRVARGFFKYWLRIFVQTALHPFNHDARPYEQESKAAQPLLLANTYPGVDCRTMLGKYL